MALLLLSFPKMNDFPGRCSTLFFLIPDSPDPGRTIQIPENGIQIVDPSINDPNQNSFTAQFQTSQILNRSNSRLLDRCHIQCCIALRNHCIRIIGNKGLLQFHEYEDEVRTPMEEHLVEAALYASSNGEANVHFTVSHDHLELFKQMVAEKADKYAQHYGIKYNISFSEQKPSTDTIAANPDNTPFRNEDGSLLFRPGGHGALIENLNEIDADVVFIKNIDNVVPDRLKAETVTWKQVIAGVLVTLQKQAFDYLKVLDSGQYNHEKLEEIIRFVQRDLCCRKADIKELEDAELVIYLRKKLNRPMRVCGVVKNVGEPGGGPFLTYNQDGTVSLQILESSQIDKNNEEYMKMFTEGTHFNPVDLVCATKDYQGNAFDLPKFVDPSTGFISSKSKNGKDLKALELPGLWNGAMSDWNTVFVEVPLGTFNPVKTVNDLLRDQHQAVEGGIKHEHHHEHGEGGCCGKH